MNSEIRPSRQIRQDFLDFFRSKEHTIVPSSSLLPDAPNLLFTNAGMNQFVPIFLGQRAPDVDQWPGAIPGRPTRAADTQKCIRAGGKHNDLEDVGLDTYHHTFFEMLGNWSFGDYFKREAIDWAWELVTEVWKFPKERLYATVYKPDPAQGDPSQLDQEAWDFWAEKFRAAGLDPQVHIVYGNKKDNFWMMGDTGPCGPCSEIHVDLTPAGDTRGALVNKGDARCIEIWNLVFIQFNANPDGTFSPLPAKHVDTGMGFERVTSIIQGTKGFTDFAHAKISNYETDIFRPIFDALEKLSGKRYGSTLPKPGTAGDTEQERIDIAFRVIADHIRTLSFAIADGIQPGNNERNYVLRRILRRAVRYGRTLGFREPFFYKLVEVLAQTMGDVFPELRQKQKHVEDVIRIEEEAFNKTLDRGIELFDDYWWRVVKGLVQNRMAKQGYRIIYKDYKSDAVPWNKTLDLNTDSLQKLKNLGIEFPALDASFAFELYDTYGFPLDLTQLMARERGLTVDVAGFNQLMDEQRERARKAQKKQIIEVSQLDLNVLTRFVGYERLETPAKVLEVVKIKDKTAVVLDTSAAYAEMGGQVGDTGEISHGGQLWRIVNTQKSGNTWLHILESRVNGESDVPLTGSEVTLIVDAPRRHAIERHHTVTHLFHWALHEVVSHDATQKGSYVGPEKLTFDFNSAPLTATQLADIEKLVNERILENAPVSWTELPYREVKPRKDILHLFGEKYGDTVRVVQIGGRPQALDGFSMELCGGTHTRATGEIGLFRLIGESAIAAGVRRVEAIAGMEAWRKANEELALLRTVSGKINAPIGELEKKVEALLAHQKELEKQLKAAQQKEAANTARTLLGRAETDAGVPRIVENLGAADADTLQAVTDALKGQFKGVIVLGGVSAGAVALVAAVTPEFTSKIQAGKIIQAIAPIVGGKGGGRPDNARGGGKDGSKLEEALAQARALAVAAKG
ncbi:MAG: alanine--tRNA ligase [Verrucomicrobiota bacterium]